jgi:hypothetical protein
MQATRRQRSNCATVLARRRLAICCAFSGLLCGLGSAPLCAADGHATLMVSAHVLPSARLQMASDLPQLQISATDVAQGYADAPRPLLLRIDSNSRAGFALDVAALSPWFTAVTLQGFDSDVLLDATGGTVVQRWLNVKTRSFELRVRFKLAATVQPGTYAWPLRLSARPL